VFALLGVVLTAIALAVASGTTAGAIVGGVTPAVATLDCSLDETEDAATALAIAVGCGTRVEATSLRTEQEQFFAEASGVMTLEATAVPVRVRRADGTWTPVDTRLTRLPDGTLAPSATTAAVRFSGGGSAPLVTVASDGRMWTMSWPAPLPVPVLDGDTATYPEVLPGVDLQVNATVDGFTHQLVVKTPEAAASDALREIRYQVGGGLASMPADGTVLVTADDGTTLATAGGADMWDADGASHSMVVRVEGDDLVVVPDPTDLTDPAVHFPLYLDPAFTAGATRWAYANNTNLTNSDGKAWVGRDPVNLNIYRSFFDFNVAALRGTNVIAASLEAKLYHSWSCTSTPVYLYRTNKITATPKATWSSMSLQKYLDTRSAHAHKGTSACGNQPDVVMWFNGNLTSDVHAGAAANWSLYTVGFCACSAASGTGESTTDRWKKFYASSVKLHVTYNSYPATPGSLATVPAATCATGASRPAINTWTPQLKATLTDPDPGATVAADFQYSVDGGATWTFLPRTAAQASGLTHTVTLPDLHASAPTFISWRVRAWDGINTSLAWSATCEFTVDTQPPADPVLEPGSALPPYPLTPPSTVVVGSPVAVPITPGGSTDVAGYWYAVSTATVSPPRQSFVAADASGNATLQVTPVVSGVSANWLTVQSVDRAGNFSREVTYSFRANAAG
jgi:hypothetical protein